MEQNTLISSFSNTKKLPRTNSDTLLSELHENFRENLKLSSESELEYGTNISRKMSSSSLSNSNSDFNNLPIKKNRQTTWYEFIIHEKNDKHQIEINDGQNLLEDIQTYMRSIYKEEMKECHVISIKQMSSCFGCRNDRPGQKEHMEENNGCLYIDDIRNIIGTPEDVNNVEIMDQSD
tara:strand:+ start:2763 stop:3296 length:534 start_codon:yes stop_codon:yes gene_type:complete